jgi:hypothetical protein
MNTLPDLWQVSQLLGVQAGVSSKLPPPPNKADGAQLVPNSLRALMALRAGQPAPGVHISPQYPLACQENGSDSANED